MTGGSFLLAVAACSNVSQGASALAVIMLSKDKMLKGMTLTSGISLLLGIVEPAAGAIGCVFIRPQLILNFFIGIALSLVTGFIFIIIFFKSSKLNLKFLE